MKPSKAQKPNILILVKVPPPITGATLMNEQVLRSDLLKDNFKVRSITISYAKSITDLGKYNLHKFLVFIKTIFNLFNEGILHRPGFVYFQVSPLGLAFYRDLIYISIIKLFRIKIVYHLHGKGINIAVRNRFNRIAYTYAFRNSEIICLSHLLQFDINEVFDGPIHIVNNGVPDIFLEKETKNLIISPTHTISVLFLSNLIISKGIVDFISALKLLNNEGVEFQANIVGAESDLKASKLNEILKESGLQNKVRYLGPKYGREKDEQLLSSDVLVFPTKNDVWGNVIIEAMQCGKSVIATREGAIPEIIDDGITGYVVEKDSPSQIAEKLKLLISNPSLRNAMGQAGRKKYEEKYTIQKFEENLLHVFCKVTNNIR